jgi:hypothetical protein
MTWGNVGASDDHRGQGEAPEVRVLSNMVTPYAGVHLALAGGVLTAEWWAMALGVVPWRRRRLALPLERVSSLRVRGRLFPDRLVVALGLVAVLYLVRLPVWGTALVGLGAVIFLLLSFVDVLEVRHEGGRQLIPFCFWQRRRVADWVREATARQAGGSGG